jgi:two-component system phosphate regulon sensor histidine kinase PhoR
VRWRVAGDAVDERRVALLARRAPSRIIATRPAHVLDEAAFGEIHLAPRNTIFNITSEAILSVAEDLTITEVNPAFSRLLGWTEAVAAGQPCRQVLRCRDEWKAPLCDTPRCPLHEAFGSSSATPVRELRWETRSGSPAEVSASFAVQRTGEDARAVIVARDVTLLNAANQMRGNFISMVSHELRTPLHSISGFLEIVLDEQVGPLNERQQEFLKYARVSTQQLAALVEDILFISKADSGQFTLRLGEVDTVELVTQVLHGLQAVAQKARVGLVSQLELDLPAAHGDALRLQQVLTNLLNNAIKFSPQEGTVYLSARTEGDEVLFSVTDEGRGIPREDHARIFERFYQSESAARTRTGGYGLGLAIAKLIVEQHCGRIWVESEPGKGSTFYFTVPIAVGDSGDSSAGA